MKTIGLIGGMSWESSIEYERTIHEEVRRRLGGAHSAKTIHWTFDFQELVVLQEAGDSERIAEELVTAARAIEGAGADLLLICTNTAHSAYPQVKAAVEVPVLHIADVAAAAIREDGLSAVGLLGTAYTMEQAFYRERLEAHHGLQVSVPDASGRADVHRVIFEELVRGVIDERSKQRYLEIIDELVAGGAEGIIAGCTEIELLVTQEDMAVPLYPTARLHALAAVDAALT